MSITLPARVRNYRISATSPTDELVVLGQIYAEVGDYASTVLDREHLALARFCSSGLKKLVPVLIGRGTIVTEDDLYDIDEADLGHTDLSSMTVDELYRLYRQWPLRHRRRIEEGREHFTFYYEGRIVRELLTRKTANKSEQFKIDYCTLTYANECENMSHVFSKPVLAGNDKLRPDSTRIYAPAELLALIRLYSDYRDITEREMLVEYTDFALDLIQRSEDKASVLELATEIADLGRKEILNCPKWLTSFINRYTASDPDQGKALSALTLA